MRIAVWAGHVGSQGLHPSGQHGGGESHTFAFLAILNRFYDVTAVVHNGVYPAFDYAHEYGLDLSDIEWKPAGDDISWLRAYDVLVNINHSQLCPPICRRNILVTFFPQYPDWDVSGYDTIIANSQFTAEWIKRYWGREAEVIYPPIVLGDVSNRIDGVIKKKQIVCVGRFFDVPGGNNKKHMVILQAFKDLMRHDWKLKFIGAIQNQQYYRQVREAAEGDERIEFLHNLSRQDYLQTLAESIFIWSATGYETLKPSSKEHFGVFTIEAMACGTIPMVHNSGGAPESGGFTWDSPQELVSKANELIDDFDLLKTTSETVIRRSQEFDIGNAIGQLVNVIEEPLALQNSGDQIKTFLPDLKPHDIKVGFISDSPMTTFGFGTISRAIVGGLIERGFRVVCFGIQDPQVGRPRLTVPDIERIVRDNISQYDGDDRAFMNRVMSEIKDIELCTIWRGCPHDNNGWSNLDKFIKEERPDVLYINYDPGNVRNIIDILRGSGCSQPLVVYLPIEGKPVTAQYIETLRLIRVLNGRTIVYTRWGSEAVVEAGGPHCEWVHHGCNHADFRPLFETDRKKLRFAVGWQNKTVLITVGRNKRTKGFGTAIIVAKMLKERGFDFVWYCHTNPFDTMPNSSMPLKEMVISAGVEDVIIFPSDLHNQGKGVPYDEPINIGPVPDTSDINQVWEHHLSTLSLIERYNLGDIYVNTSELEGFGLPPLEAMGCGLPVVSVDDQGVQREVLGTAPAYVPVAHWDTTWHTGSRLAQANPKDMADAIMSIANGPELKAELQKASLEHYHKFKWSNTVDVLARVIMEQVL